MANYSLVWQDWALGRKEEKSLDGVLKDQLPPKSLTRRLIITSFAKIVSFFLFLYFLRKSLITLALPTFSADRGVYEGCVRMV